MLWGFKKSAAKPEFDQRAGVVLDPEEGGVVGDPPGLRKIVGHDHNGESTAQAFD